MLRQNVMQLLWTITLTAVTAASAHGKVVVPLFGEEVKAVTSKTVFVTQMNYIGDQGGPLGADAKCQSEPLRFISSTPLFKRKDRWLSSYPLKFNMSVFTHVGKA